MRKIHRLIHRKGYEPLSYRKMKIVRLLSRCSESDMELFLSILTAILSNKDKVPTVVKEESIGESYKKAFTEMMNTHKSNC